MDKNETFAVETVALTKIYKGKAAVNHLDLKVREGAIYGFIGRNGAGKSTTLKMLCGLVKPAEGEIRLFGKPVQDPFVARRIGCLIESAGLYPKMTARQNMIMKARCMGLSDEKSVDRILERTGLSDTGNKPTKLFSMGMKQRLGVALALLGNPDLLILDEPINGLDPEGVREIRQLILSLNEEGKTFLISSHILGELSKISTHYGIIKDGNLVDQISRQELGKNCADYYQIEVDDVKRSLPLIEEHLKNIQAEVQDNRTIRIYGLAEGVALNRLLVENQIQVYASGFHHMDLEEYFLARMDDSHTGDSQNGKKGEEKNV
ncbi:MAG: ABC transporter ATP-binding protein [Lachnospiraceae bacterium]|nr:ABC transporter ATP-binding protein [Lachnospiraceae bacterium]